MREMREIAAEATAVRSVKVAIRVIKFIMVRNAIRSSRVLLAVAVLLSVAAASAGKKYDNPITKDTQQPDKVLFDKAINDIEHSRFEIARLLLQNLINTYDTSEYLAKAKLAIADAWFREGGVHGLAQAEAEYKDFILFYPHDGRGRRGAGKGLRHPLQADGKGRIATPCTPCARRRNASSLLLQFPNSKFAPASAADAAQHSGSAGRQANSASACCIRKGQLPGRGQPLAGRGRPVPALQQGR